MDDRQLSAIPSSQLDSWTWIILVIILILAVIVGVGGLALTGITPAGQSAPTGSQTTTSPR